MLVFALASEVQSGASGEELLFTFIFIIMITGVIHSSVSNRITLSEARRDSKKLAKKYREERRDKYDRS